MWNKLVYDRGGLPLHAGCKVIPTEHGDQRRPDRRPLGHGQDDDHLHAPERLAAGAGRLRRAGCRTARSTRPRPAASPRLRADPEDEPTIHGAVTQPDAYLENVSQHGDEVDFFDTCYTPERPRDVPVRRDRAPPTREIDDAHFLLILNRNENIIPAVAKLERPQAAAYFMLGETQGTSRRRRRRGGQVPARARARTRSSRCPRPPGQPLPGAAGAAPARRLPDEHRPRRRLRRATRARRRSGSSTRPRSSRASPRARSSGSATRTSATRSPRRCPGIDDADASPAAAASSTRSRAAATSTGLVEPLQGRARRVPRRLPGLSDEIVAAVC